VIDRNKLIALAAVAAALIALMAWQRGCHAAEVSSPLALAKCRVIVETLYPDSGFRPWCGTLIAEHERYADLKGAPSFAASWWDSLTYGAANFGLRVGATAPGLCSGPMDCKATSRAEHRRLTRDTAANIRHHTAEAWEGYSKGYRGINNAFYVFLPRCPRDWGNSRFRKTDARHREVIREAYAERRLP